MDNSLDNSLNYALYYRIWHDATSAHFDEMASFFKRILKPVLPSIHPNARILDLGCGQGLLVYALGIGGYTSVEGVDISPQQIDVAKEKGLNCRLVQRDFTRVLAATSPGSYDVIFLMDVLEHVPRGEQPALVDDLSRLLVPGGKLILSVPNANSSFGLRWRYNDWTHECSFTEHSLTFLLLNKGFSEVKFFPYEFVKRPDHLVGHTKGYVLWFLHRVVRGLRRVEAVAEFGKPGLEIPLSLNLLAQAITPATKNM